MARWVYPHATLQSERPWSDDEVSAMLRRHVPPGSSVAQVQSYFVRMHWQHWYPDDLKHETFPPPPPCGIRPTAKVAAIEKPGRAGFQRRGVECILRKC